MARDLDGAPAPAQCPSQSRRLEGGPSGLLRVLRGPAHRAVFPPPPRGRRGRAERRTPRPPSTPSSTSSGGSPSTTCASARSFGRLQAYPSRRKNPEVVDLSTGSMGLGARRRPSAPSPRAMGPITGAPSVRSACSSWWATPSSTRAMCVEALLEEPVAALGTVRWIVDMNRPEPGPRDARLAAPPAARHVRGGGAGACWSCAGALGCAPLRRSGGASLARRLEAMSNAEYHALLRLPAAAARKALVTASDGARSGARAPLLGRADDGRPGAPGGPRRPRSAARDRGLCRGGTPTHPALGDLSPIRSRAGASRMAGDPMNHGAAQRFPGIETLRSGAWRAGR